MTTGDRLRESMGALRMSEKLERLAGRAGDQQAGTSVAAIRLSYFGAGSRVSPGSAVGCWRPNSLIANTSLGFVFTFS